MTNKPMVSRRDFLKIVAFSGAVGLGLKYAPVLLEQSATISETRLLMGTLVNLTLIGDDREAARLVVQSCLNQMENLEMVLSRFKTDSQLSQLNRTGILEKVDRHLLNLIEQSRTISEFSNGAFDITIKPLIDLYQEYQLSEKGIPSKEDIQRTLKFVDYRNLIVNGDEIKFGCPGMAITLDAIAKGYIVDQGVAVLRQNGFQNVMVEAGGDLLASGQKGNHDPWKIGVQSPRKEVEGFIARLSINNSAVATSGDYLQPFSKDFSEYHILDPRTGYSSKELASATVLAPTAALADALATTVMVLGVEKGLNLIRNFSRCDAFLVTKDLQKFQTDHFPFSS